MLSDLFTERPQYDWLLKVLLGLLQSHPLEDELISQYLVIGVCKAAAVLGVVSMLLLLLLLLLLLSSLSLKSGMRLAPMPVIRFGFPSLSSLIPFHCHCHHPSPVPPIIRSFKH